METNQLQGPDMGVFRSFKFAWANQGTIIKLLACPILFQIINTAINMYMTGNMPMHMDQPVSSPMQMVMGQLGMMIPALLLSLMATVMIIVRLYRFYLSGEDVSQVPFFSFGGREFRVLGYSLLLTVAMGLIIGGLIGVTMLFDIKYLPIIVGVVGVIFVLYASLRLTFIFPDIALDRPVSVSRAWGEMKGSVGTLFWKMLLAVLFFGLIFMVPVVLIGMVMGSDMNTSGLNQMGTIGQVIMSLYMIWISVLFSALMYRIVSGLYRYKVSS